MSRVIEYGPEKMQVPSDWEVKPLGRIFELNRGVNYNSEKYCEINEGMLFLTLNSIKKGGGLNRSGIKYYADDINDDKKVEAGDLLIANTDLTQDGDIIGYPILVPDFGRGACFSHHLSKLSGDYSQFHTPYLFEFLRTRVVHNRMRAFSAGSTVLNLDSDSVRQISLPIPPIHEQRRISNILSTADDQIQRTEEIINKTKELKRGLMQDLYTRGTEHDRETQSTRIGEIPANWDLATINQYAEVVSGTHVKSDLVSNDDSQTPYITGPSDFTRTGIRVSKYTDSATSFCKKGDTLVTVKGMSCGKSSFADSSVGISRQLKAIRPGTDLDEKYLFYWIRYKEKLLYVLAEGTRQLGLSTSDLTSLPIPVPPIEEQEAIGNILIKIDRKITQEMQTKQDLEDLKRGLMQDLLTGKVRVSTN